MVFLLLNFEKYCSIKDPSQNLPAFPYTGKEVQKRGACPINYAVWAWNVGKGAGESYQSPFRSQALPLSP